MEKGYRMFQVAAWKYNNLYNLLSQAQANQSMTSSKKYTDIVEDILEIENVQHKRNLQKDYTQNFQSQIGS